MLTIEVLFDDSQWIVRRSDRGRSESVHGNRSAAEVSAIALAMANRPSEVLVRDKSGRVVSQRTFGSDTAENAEKPGESVEKPRDADNVSYRPEATVAEEALREAGFTGSGRARFQETVDDYADLLYEKAVRYGDADRGRELPREVTHDHVRAAAHSIASRFGKPSRSNWSILGQVLEYVGVGVSSLGAGHLDKTWGIILFVAGLVGAGVLIAVRLSNEAG